MTRATRIMLGFLTLTAIILFLILAAISVWPLISPACATTFTGIGLERNSPDLGDIA